MEEIVESFTLSTGEIIEVTKTEASATTDQFEILLITTHEINEADPFDSNRYVQSLTVPK